MTKTEFLYAISKVSGPLTYMLTLKFDSNRLSEVKITLSNASHLKYIDKRFTF